MLYQPHLRISRPGKATRQAPPKKRKQKRKQQQSFTLVLVILLRISLESRS